MEYIEREAATRAALISDCEDVSLNDVIKVTEEVAEAIKKIPAADVVPVVRCKDCLYGSENGFICGNVHGLQYAFPNAFCSNGTKRE